MKIRMDRTMYAVGKRIADAHGDTFARWAYRAERKAEIAAEAKRTKKGRK